MKTNPWWKFFGWLSFVLLWVFVALACYWPIETEDIWFHLATGRWMVEHQAVPWVDPFTFAAPSGSWIFTEWLGSLIYYGAYWLGGYEGLKIFRVLLFLAIFLLFWRYSRRRIPFVFLAFLILIALEGLADRMLLRPFVFNLLFIQIYLWVLFRYHKDQKNTLWVLPLLSVVWFNLHVGCFVYGLTIVGIFLLNETVNFLNLQFAAVRNACPLEKSIYKIKGYVLVVIGCLVSFFVSPYGVAGFIYPFQTFLIPANTRLLFLDLVKEQQPPDLVRWGGAWFLILVMWVAAMIWQKKRDRFLYVILFICPLFLFLHGARGSDFFVIVSLCLIAEMAEDLNWCDRWRSWQTKRTLSRWLLVVLSGVLLVSIGRYQNDRKVILDDGVFSWNQLTFDPSNNIVNLVGLLKQSNIQGTVFTREITGGFLTWAGYPQLKPFIDGRKLDADKTYELLHVFHFPERYWPWIEERYHLNIVMLDVVAVESDKLTKYLQRRSDWQLVFLKGSNAVFLRKNVFKLLPETLALESRLQNAVLKESFPVVTARMSNPVLQKFFQPPPTYVQAHQEGMALFLLGYHVAGLNRVLDALPYDWSSRTQEVYAILRQEMARTQQRTVEQNH